MKYNLLGNTGLKVSEICLGTMTFGGEGIFKDVGNVVQAQADVLIKLAVEKGVNFIDTANMYSAGRSEEIVGQAIRNIDVPRDSLILATKVRVAMGSGPNDLGLSRKHILQEVEASLKRLKTDYIDLYQIHAWDPLTPIEETLSVLDDLVRTGKVRYIGASNISAWQMMKALGSSLHNKLEKFVSLQAYYSLASRELEREIVPMLQDQKVGLMVWSPLAAGLLSGKYTRDNEGKAGGRRDKVSFPIVDTNKAFTILDVLRPMAAAKDVTVAQLSLAWLLYQPVVSSIIVGANNQEQLTDNLGASEIRFSAEELMRLDEVSRIVPEYPGWMIAYGNLDRQ
jgi:aryl-alcohol dehydrogenase-like predicted oxidoreductase